ncbi:transcriptional regulator, AsnC family [Arboricoccus pini]|uniref:Transcriptional regulator, AsnC family n=1 Tax=Arboricoccus pini TaxID=1963835 RepID=A0A212R7Z6_9PROT|nr:Lrp/AsnC family transcriptional regulator [Arboricoccus pini]SNB68100.1 transcriptional regulator, AsnC family [Arboricoccus pini]
MTVVDDIDRRILRELRQDARISNAKLADVVGLSPSACLRRLRTLERNKVIRGYTAMIDEPGAEAVTVIIVQITLERQTEDSLLRFEAAVRRCPEVGECYLMSGMADYLLRVEVRDAAHYERIHTEQLSRMPGVARIHSNFSIRSVIRARAL